MQDHQYITDRLLPDIVRQICSDHGITTRSFSDDWVLTLERHDVQRVIYGFKMGGLNDGAAVAVSQDKVATYELLKQAGISAVPHVLISTRANTYDNWKTWAKKWHQFVLKPTHGSGGRAIYASSDVKQAQDLMIQNGEQAWCVSPFLSIKAETRLILLGNQILLAFEKHDPVAVHDVPMYNLRLGAMAVTVKPAADLTRLAIAARRALGLQLVAVDIVTLKTGEQLVLEVNEGFSLEHYMRQSPDNKRRAQEVYGLIINAMMASAERKEG